MTKILILGGGFAAVAAAEEFIKSGNDSLDVTLISATRDFTFYPALVPYVFGDLEIKREEIKFNLAAKLAERKIRFIESEVLSIDPKKRVVAITGEDVEGMIHYDYLIIALGRRLATERVPGFFEHAYHLLGVDAADRFRNAINKFTSGSIVVGLCPGAFLPVPVCESAFALADRFADKIKSGKVSVTAVFPESVDDAFFGSALFRDLPGSFARRGIELVSKFHIETVGPGRLFSDTAASLPFDLLMLVPPFRGQAPLHNLAGAIDGTGFAEVNELMQVQGNDRIYAAGDIVSLPGPRFGYMAVRQGKVAAANILSQAAGQEPAAQYDHNIAWAVSEKYTDSVFFHYGFWDESLDDYDENAFFGMAKPIRKKYGPIKGFGKPLGEFAGNAL